MKHYPQAINSRRARWLFRFWKWTKSRWASREYMALIMRAHERDWLERRNSK